MRKINQLFAGVALSGLMTGCSGGYEGKLNYPTADNMANVDDQGTETENKVPAKKSGCNAFADALTKKATIEANGGYASPEDHDRLAILSAECDETFNRLNDHSNRSGGTTIGY